MLKRTVYNATAIPTSYLDLVKTHCRVDFETDDDYLKSAIRRAVGLIERTTSFLIAPSTYEWTPGYTPGYSFAGDGGTGEASNRCQCCNLAGYNHQSGWKLPCGPVSAFTAMVQPATGDPVDNEANLELAGDLIDPSQFNRVWLVIKDGATLTPGKITIELTTGSVLDGEAVTLEPGIEDIVLRLTAYLYENRELSNMPGFDAEAFAASIDTGLWTPFA